MGSYKLRIKIGPYEFEAEGPQDAVQKQFEAFKTMIDSGTIPVPEVAEESPPTDTDDNSAQTLQDLFSQAQLDVLYAHDSKRKLVSLRMPVQGQRRAPDAILLILLGYRMLRNDDEVPVTQLKPALAQSGIRVQRVDRQTERYINDGLLLKIGRGKGGRYRLTNKGQAIAEGLMKELLEGVG